MEPPCEFMDHRDDRSLFQPILERTHIRTGEEEAPCSDEHEATDSLLP